MYKRETKAIGRLFEVSMLKKYGPENLATHYAEFDTICDATQVRNTHSQFRCILTVGLTDEVTD